MHFLVKMPENGGENIFIDKQKKSKVKITCFSGYKKNQLKCTWCDLERKLEQDTHS